MALTAIQKIARQASRIRNGNSRITPGEPHRISEAATAGDGVWQGDLGIEVVVSVPEDYVKVENAVDKDRQLVPGNTEGSKHCLDSLVGVELFRPKDWGSNYEGLEGPACILSKQRIITHPKHGDVTIPACTTVRCRYQREFDAEQQRERRNAD